MTAEPTIADRYAPPPPSRPQGVSMMNSERLGAEGKPSSHEQNGGLTVVDGFMNALQRRRRKNVRMRRRNRLNDAFGEFVWLRMRSPSSILFHVMHTIYTTDTVGQDE